MSKMQTVKYIVLSVVKDTIKDTVIVLIIFYVLFNFFRIQKVFFNLFNQSQSSYQINYPIKLYHI